MSPSTADSSPALGPPRARWVNLAIAWRNLMQNRRRTLTALGGITFALLLVFMQLGFLLAARRGATLLYDDLAFDIAIVSERYQSLASIGRFLPTRLAQAASVPGVEAVAGLQVRNASWLNAATGEGSTVMVFGLPEDLAFIRNPGWRAGLGQLRSNEELLVDVLSHDDLGDLSVGVRTELNGVPYRVVGQFEQGMSMFGEGAAAMRMGGFERLFRGASAEVSIGLVRVQPGADREATLRALRAALPADVVVQSRTTLMQQDQDYFVAVKPVGIVFQTGVFVAFAVGVVILFQVLSTEVSNRLREYATIKALGFGNRFIYGIGVLQAVLFGGFSFLPALLLSWGVYTVVRVASRLPMVLTPQLVALVFGLALVMCVISCALALGKVRRADPAELF